jgi:cyclophilin family peptidyl-prolyl cis-trans isomerase
MKSAFLVLAVSIASIASAQADDCALVTLKVGKEKELRRFAIEFYEGDAPTTVENFKKLAKKGFYKGTAIHRAFPNTLVQMGDPISKDKDRTKVGTGGPGYTVQPEIRRKHTKGAVVAARLPDRLNPSRVSNGSQFFVCLKPIPSYDGQNTVFGNVLWGLDALDALSTRSTDTNDYPVDRIVVRSVKIMDRSKLPAPPQPATTPAAKPGRRWWQFFG